MSATSKINEASAKQIASEAKREVPRDLMVGVEKLREKRYLRRNAVEQPRQVPSIGIVDPYLNRVESSRLTNMFREAVEDAAGRAFAKPAKPAADIPKQLEEFLDDVDGEGTNFQVFGKEVAETSVAEGEDFVLVDYPQRAPGQNLTVDQEKDLKLAPFWRRYSPANVIDWKFGSRGRAVRLEWVKLREWVDGEVQVRRLFAGVVGAVDASQFARFEVWKPAKQSDLGGEWQIVNAGSMDPQTEIPLVEFPSDLAAPFMALPPYLDLAHLTIAHYRKLSSLDHAQELVGFPTKYAAGFQKEDFGDVLASGPENFFISSNPDASINIVEPEGTTWASVRVELDRMEAEGKQMSAAPQMSEVTVQRTATDAMISAAGRTSKLQSWVLGWQDAFARLLRYTAIYMGIVKPDDESGWGAIELNGQFLPLGSKIEAARLAHERNIAGKLSDETTHEVFVQAEILPETLDFKSERQRIENEGPSEPTAEDRNAPDLTAEDDERAA